MVSDYVSLISMNKQYRIIKAKLNLPNMDDEAEDEDEDNNDECARVGATEEQASSITSSSHPHDPLTA